MAHNLNIQKDGSAAFFTVKEKAWHGLGKVVESAPNSAEAIQLAGMDWEVLQAPLKAHIALDGGKKKAIEVPGKFANYRNDTDEVLGVVGNRYEVVQNVDAFSFFDAIVGEGEAIYETAGVLGKGENIFITAKLPSYIKVGRNDLIEQYIFITNSHDGHGSITAAFTPIRIVCNNTLNAALHQNSMKVSIRHTSSAKEKLTQAHKLMGITNKLSVEMGEIFNQMTKKKIADSRVTAIIQQALAPSKEAFKLMAEGSTEISPIYRNQVDAALEYAFGHETQLMPSTKGTVFGAYNAVTGYFQNVAESRSEEAKLNSINAGGTIYEKTSKAFNLALDFLN